MMTLVRHASTSHCSGMSMARASFNLATRRIAPQMIQRCFSADSKLQVTSPYQLDADSKKKKHFILAVIPQGCRGVWERFGKFQQVLEPGLQGPFIPFVDRISYFL